MIDSLDKSQLRVTQQVAKLIVNHFVNFKGCSYHNHDPEITYGIKAFRRNWERSGIPKTDFALDECLPKEAREEEIDDIDRRERMLSAPLSFTSHKELSSVAQSFRRVLTGIDDSGMMKSFSMEVGNLMYINEKVKRMTDGRVSVDVNSALALFTDLSMIKYTIDMSINFVPWKNLDFNVHIAHEGIPLYKVPHFFLGTFS